MFQRVKFIYNNKVTKVFKNIKSNRKYNKKYHLALVFINNKL